MGHLMWTLWGRFGLFYNQNVKYFWLHLPLNSFHKNEWRTASNAVHFPWIDLWSARLATVASCPWSIFLIPQGGTEKKKMLVFYLEEQVMILSKLPIILIIFNRCQTDNSRAPKLSNSDQNIQGRWMYNSRLCWEALGPGIYVNATRSMYYSTLF